MDVLMGIIIVWISCMHFTAGHCVRIYTAILGRCCGLRLASTNRDPAVTLGYFLECIDAMDGNYYDLLLCSQYNYKSCIIIIIILPYII